MKKILVSVIMPVYNGENFISEAVDSILMQTYKRFELFIVNDCSSDATYEIIEAYKKRFPKKIHIIHLNKRHGAFGAMNTAMKYIKGEFIAPMDSDDISHPERLQKEVEFMLKNPEIIVVGSFAHIIDKDGNIVGKKVFGTSHQEIYSSFFTVHPIVHPSCMIRRKMLPKKDKLYRDKFGVNDDYYTFLTLLGRCKFANIPEYLLNYRIHSGNSSLQNLKQKFFTTVKIRFLAVKDLGYRPDFTGVLKLLTQVLFVSFIPEQMLLKLYLYIKGVYIPKDVIKTAVIRPALKYG